ncbi:POP7-like protein [Mya arenaria]|uniref:POP7-like protein n=1 Tax=Mya arenaria TaxID=6604 RepID=A0ABY7F9F3_MYAAR|nr:ribonuclease P protein subunit p20-like [Mya arenaria]WAR18227.1 POP7-like protein [Mya arenaria]
MATNDDNVKHKDKARIKQAAIKELIDNEECVLRKRLPRKLPKRDCDVYVTRKTDFKQQLKRCQNILDNGNLVCIHGLGQAINRAINLALQLQASGMGGIEINTHTSTVELVDDIEPLNDDRDADVLSRNNSAIHIRVYRPSLQGTIDKINELDKEAKSNNT